MTLLHQFKAILALFGLVAILLQATELSLAGAIEYTTDGIAIVGTTESLNITVTAGTSREDLISYEFASYIAVHFADFNLPDGDSVVITSPDDNDTVSHTYTGRGRDQAGTFIASFIAGNSVTVTYNSVGTASAGQGYRITGYSRGYPSKQEETICGDGDQSLPAKCYAPGTNLSEELPLAYKRSQAVARLLINGSYLCTGWLGGSEGHLFTNQHCFEQEDWALSTDIEFGAESSSCSEECETQLGCPGTIVATTSTFITSSEDIDYAVVKLPDCVDLSSYGYLQLRESGPVVNESIYVPQHPVGYAKRIVSTVDDGSNTTIRSVGEDGDCGEDQVGHDADTEGGSSGSPLMANSDNLVVAIHHCGGCTNTAIDVRTVLSDLAAKNISIQNLVATSGDDQKSQPAYAQTPCTAQVSANATKVAQNRTMPGGNLTAPKSSKTNSTTQDATPIPAANSSKSSPCATSQTVLSSSTTPAPTPAITSMKGGVSTRTTASSSKEAPSPTSATTSISGTATKAISTPTPALTPDTTVTASSTATKSALSSGTSTSTKATKSLSSATSTAGSSVAPSPSAMKMSLPSTATAKSGLSQTPDTISSSKYSSKEIPTPAPTSVLPTSSKTVTSECTPTPSTAATPLPTPSSHPCSTPATTSTGSPTSSSKGSQSTPTTTTPGSKTLTPSPTPVATTSTAPKSTPATTTVDTSIIVAKLKAAVESPSPTPVHTTTSNSSPVATPAATSTASKSSATPEPTILTATSAPTPAASGSMGDDNVEQN